MLFSFYLVRISLAATCDDYVLSSPRTCKKSRTLNLLYNHPLGSGREWSDTPLRLLWAEQAQLHQPLLPCLVCYHHLSGVPLDCLQFTQFAGELGSQNWAQHVKYAPAGPDQREIISSVVLLAISLHSALLHCCKGNSLDHVQLVACLDLQIILYKAAFLDCLPSVCSVCMGLFHLRCGVLYLYFKRLLSNLVLQLVKNPLNDSSTLHDIDRLP